MKTLQLKGLSNYASPRTKNKVITKGQVITVDDADAAYMTKPENGESVNGAFTPHWVEVPNGTPADHHFATVALSDAEAEDAAKITAAVVEEKKVTATTKPVGGTIKRSQRAPRAGK